MTNLEVGINFGCMCLQIISFVNVNIIQTALLVSGEEQICMYVSIIILI